MRCPACNTTNRDDAAYCLHCGSSLVPVCLRCGWELPSRAQFCDGCGTRRGDPTPAIVGWRDTAAAARRRLAPTAYADRQLAASGKMVGERRLVTILMSDVKGSGAMSRDLDPQERLEILGGAFEVHIEPIARYGCTVDRLEDDAILALFGVPIAH
jgi:hypothetical protein